jgi:hypothetical protein
LVQKGVGHVCTFVPFFLLQKKALTNISMSRKKLCLMCIQSWGFKKLVWKIKGKPSCNYWNLDHMGTIQLGCTQWCCHHTRFALLFIDSLHLDYEVYDHIACLWCSHKFLQLELCKQLFAWWVKDPKIHDGVKGLHVCFLNNMWCWIFKVVAHNSRWVHDLVEF